MLAMLFNNLYWREPLWLLLIMLPVLLVLIIRYRQKYLWSTLADEALLPWVQERSAFNANLLVRIMLLITWALFCIALSGPRSPQYIPPDLQAEKETVIVIVDFSASMNAKDGLLNQNRFSRIDASQQFLEKILGRLPKASRLGIVIYAGHAHVLLKPTNDHALVQHYIEQLDQIKLPTLGNDLAGAIELAKTELSASGDKQHLLLLTDGDMDKKARMKAQAVLDRLIMSSVDVVRLKVVGVGGVEAVSLPETKTKFLVVDGKPVISRLESIWLKQLAFSAKGQFIKMHTLMKKPLDAFIDFSPPRIKPDDQQRVLWDEWFTIPLLSGVFILLLLLQFRSATREEEE